MPSGEKKAPFLFVISWLNIVSKTFSYTTLPLLSNKCRAFGLKAFRVGSGVLTPVDKYVTANGFGTVTTRKGFQGKKVAFGFSPFKSVIK